MAAGNKSPDDRAGMSWLRYSHLGIQFCLTLLLFTGAGWWADARWGTRPWLLITGSMVGMGGAMWSVIREVSPTRRP